MSIREGCKAYQIGDQWFCDDCAVTWDTDDTPPDCRPDKQKGLQT